MQQPTSEALALPTPRVVLGTHVRPMRQPSILVLLMTVKALGSFAWFGVALLLPVYLVSRWGLAQPAALGLVGVFAGVLALAPLFGGWIADRLLGMRRAATAGAALLALGGLLLGVAEAVNPSGLVLVLAGMACIALGAGAFEPALFILTGEIYEDGDHRRDSGFTFLYGAARAGGLVSVPIAGGIAVTLGWTAAFCAMAAAGFAAFVLLLRAERTPIGELGAAPEAHARMLEIVLKPGGAVAVLVAGQVAVRRATETFGQAEGLLVLGALVLVVALWLGDSPLTPGERRRAGVLVVAGVFFVAFWAMFDRAGVAIDVFTEEAAAFPDGWVLPATGVAAVLAAPLLAWLWMRLDRVRRRIGTVNKMAVGMLLLGAAFALLWLAGALAEAGAPSANWMPIAGVVLLGAGEVGVAAAGISLVTRLAPVRLAGTVMGAWLVARGAGARIAVLLGLLMPEGQGMAARPAFAVPGWSNFFLIFLGVSVAAGASLIVLAPFLRRGMRARN